MALGLIQGALGQPFASAVEGPAFAVLNEILGAYHTDGGFARPARYEVILQMPTGQGGSRNPNVNPISMALNIEKKPSSRLAGNDLRIIFRTGS